MMGNNEAEQTWFCIKAFNTIPRKKFPEDFWQLPSFVVVSVLWQDRPKTLQ